MCRKLICLTCLVSMLSTYTVVRAEVFSDDFDTPYDYLTEGIGKTGWDGFTGLGEDETVDALNVSMDREGQLYIESTGGYWHEPWDPVGPFFYKTVNGDFSVIVRVTDFAGTLESILEHNAAGIMVRNPESDTGDENWVAIGYFPTWTAFIAWNTTNNSRAELGQTTGTWLGDDTFAIAEQYPYLQIERIGDEFHLRISSDGLNFVPLTDPAYQGVYDGSQTPLVINRPDLPSTLQIGLFHATFSANTGYVAFDDFRLEGPEVSVGKAALPNPSNGAVDLPRNTNLSWKPGIYADKHNVYFGTDVNDVNEASPTDPRGVLAGENHNTVIFGPGLLDFDRTYYWRVDEVNDAEPNSPWKGNVWSFSTASFIVVEDFEDYNDYEPDTVYLTWIDGWDDPMNGSTSGYPNPIFTNGEHYMETTIVHGGSQSMPLFYDNSSAGLSEVTRTLNADWTQDDVVALTLFYYGDAGNAVEPMYVAVNGNAVVTNGAPDAVLANDWVQWTIPLQSFSDQGVNLANVTTLSIGLGNKSAPQAGGGSGHVFFDDIRLYRSLPDEPEPGPEPVDPGTDNLVAYYSFENNADDSSGNGYNATINGNVQYVSGPTGYGKALGFDGANDYVRLPIGSAIASMSDITVSTWANFFNLGGGWQRLWDFGMNDQIYMFVTPRIGTNGQLRFAIATDTVAEASITGPATLPSGWHHVTVVIDSSSMTMMLYQDGKLVADGPTPLLPSDLGETTENYLGRSQFAADSFYLGSLDEFRIYDRALSVEEILFLAGK
ncbi:MAG: hypothetical protein JW837_13365 [Sedimentisphaerales bacterium]|nr:hypothetical protein [Sedimentisphaerales bacterium]